MMILGFHTAMIPQAQHSHSDEARHKYFALSCDDTLKYELASNFFPWTHGTAQPLSPSHTQSSSNMSLLCKQHSDFELPE
jgi:hypothetical protein